MDTVIGRPGLKAGGGGGGGGGSGGVGGGGGGLAVEGCDVIKPSFFQPRNHRTLGMCLWGFSDVMHV